VDDAVAVEVREARRRAGGVPARPHGARDGWMSMDGEQSMASVKCIDGICEVHLLVHTEL
jgi:hypothetical protein